MTRDHDARFEEFRCDFIEYLAKKLDIKRETAIATLGDWLVHTKHAEHLAFVEECADPARAKRSSRPSRGPLASSYGTSPIRSWEKDRVARARLSPASPACSTVPVPRTSNE